MSISIEKVSYENSKDCRILVAVLTNWFKNPKELNLIEPRLKYPFNFKKWKMESSSVKTVGRRTPFSRGSRRAWTFQQRCTSRTGPRKGRRPPSSARFPSCSLNGSAISKRSPRTRSPNRRLRIRSPHFNSV